jgi:hypothetical protein
MEHLQIAAGDDTPAVDFHAETGVLVLEGEAYPENPVAFFEPLMNWISQYIEEISGPLTLNIMIRYINTSSSKCMLDFLEALDTYYESGGKVAINWYYEKNDEDMQETGEELCEDLELPYTLIPK